MSLIQSQANLLKQAAYLLKDIEAELHFRAPYSSKLKPIRELLQWLKDGQPVGCFRHQYGSEQADAAADEHFELSDSLTIDDSLEPDAFWQAPLAQLLAESALCENIMLKLSQGQAQELIYNPLIYEAGKPFFFILSKTREPQALAAFVQLFCHYLRYNEQLDWQQIQPNNVQDLMCSIVIPSLAKFRESMISEVIVMDETHWHSAVALENILQHASDPEVGIWLDGLKLSVDENYMPPIDNWILNALQLQPDGDNPLQFFETPQQYVLFGS
ncbi:hypothetical protein [Agarivorans sp. Z349TD_8]|uniref:hypothetical protein n=1 Tax=Agarivorans sp. Z349TD_8 TaxID=3421434 RepID=UPI003D7E5E7A